MQASRGDDGGTGFTCATWSESLDEPLAGTAPVSANWLCLEQPGPWGHDALRQSHLDPELGEALAVRAASTGIRIQLIRRPGKHPDTGVVTSRRVYLAHCGPGETRLSTFELTDPAELLDLDFARLARGQHPASAEPAGGPVLLICTNGRRDRCCALRGRALIDQLGDRHRDQLWETTHTGGHRFAPTAVLLPSGYNYGRLNAHDVDAVLSAAAAGKVATQHCRGRSMYSQPAQVAELAVRELVGECSEESLRVEIESDHGETGHETYVAHRDGRGWRVSLSPIALSPARPNSCGKEPAEGRGWRVERIVRE